MKRIDTSKWREFRIGDLFTLSLSSDDLQPKNFIEGDIPLISSGKTNNGVVAYIQNDATLQSANTITVDMFGKAFYQNKPYYCVSHGRVNILAPMFNMTECCGLYLASVIEHISRKKYEYNEMCTGTKLAEDCIKLPVTTDGSPDWNYMESYMHKVLKEAKAHLDNLSRTAKEQSQIDTTLWKTYRLDEIFYMRNTHSITQKDITPDSGTTPYVTASNINNGVMTYIDCPEEWKDKGNCIMIGGKTLTFSYQQQDFCSNDSHNIALYAIDSRGANELCYLFMISALRSAFSSKYSWSDSISMKKIKDEVFNLPSIGDGSPDWDYMESYMRKMLKQAKENLDLLTNVQV